MYGMLSGEHLHGSSPSFPIFHHHHQQQQQLQEQQLFVQFHHQQQQHEYDHQQEQSRSSHHHLLSPATATTATATATAAAAASSSSGSSSHGAVFLSGKASLKAVQQQQQQQQQSSNNISSNSINNNSSSNNSSWEVATATATAAAAAAVAATAAATARTGQAAPEQEQQQHFHRHRHYTHNEQLLAIDSAAAAGGVPRSSAAGGFAGEPTSVLDLRSPSPNNSRALDSASSSSAIIRNTAKKRGAASSSSSSDCNNSTSDASKVKSSRGDHQQQQQQHQQQHQQRQQQQPFSSPAQLQDELEQAVAAAGAPGGYGLSLFYSGQGIRQMENYPGFGHQQQQQQELLHQQQQQQHQDHHRGADQWLLQDVVGAQQQDEMLLQQQHHHLQQQHQLQQQQGLEPEKQKLEELASELLGSCPSPGVQAAAAGGAPVPDSSSFIRWLFEETSSAPAIAAEINAAAPAPPWQQQVMMMVKQEQQHQQHQQQQQLPASSSISTLPPHLAHLESFTRRTLPLAAPPLFHHHPHPMQFQDPLGSMNLLWQQQLQHNLQIGLEQQQQQQQQHHHQQRDPFLLGMIQDEQHQQHMPNLFGQSPPGSGFIQSSPRAVHPGLPVENLSSSPFPQQHDDRQQQHPGKRQQQQQSLRSPYLDDHALFRSQGHKRDHQQQQQHELQHPSTKVARLSPPNAQTGHPLHKHVPGPTSGAFPSRLLLHAAEACEGGQDELAQSILARLNDHHHHHQQVFLQHHQDHSQNPKLHSPAYRIGHLFREILVDRLAKRKSGTTGTRTTGSSSATPSATPSSTEAAGFEAAEVVDRIAACKSLYDTSSLLKVSHFIANQAIAESIESEECVHILDLSEAANSPSTNSSFGGQWSSFVASILEQKLPRRIKIRITLASTRQHALYFALECLKDLARDHPKNTGCAEFEFSGVLTRPGTPLNLSEMGLKMHEALVVNFVQGLHKFVPAADALESIRSANPKLVLIVEQELESTPSFVDRFRESLEYYTAIAEGVAADDCLMKDVDKVEQLVWKPEIEGFIAGGTEQQRIEKWKLWANHAGLCSVKLGEMCEKLALGLFNFEKTGNNKSRGFDLVKDDGALLLRFQGKILMSASAWNCC